MGFWVGRPVLHVGEAVRWSPPANRDQGGRAVGGRLFVTQSRMVFQPNRIDALFGGKNWECDLDEIDSFGTVPRDGNPFSGGVRNRLRVETSDGDVERFVIRDPEIAAQHLRALASASGSEPLLVSEARSPSFRLWYITGLIVLVCMTFLFLNIFVWN